MSTTYNDDGTKDTETNAVGGVTTFSYHPNRMVKQVAAPATTSGPKAVVDYRYDTAGRVVRTINPGIDAAGASRPEELIDYTPQGQVSVRRETSAIPGVWRTTTYAYDAHGELARTAGPRTVAGEQEATEADHDGFGQVTLTRRRLAGRWLSTPTSYDAAGNAVATSTLTGTNQLLTSTYRYDALGRVAAQTADPTNPDHEVAFTYEGEGAQLTRVDLRQSAGPSSGACGDAGVSCVAARTTTNAYNPDATPRSTVSTDAAGLALLTCNYPAGASPAAGWDADKHPLVVRTLTGTTVCGGGGTLEREVTMGWDSRGLLTTTTQSVRSPETGTMVTRAQSFTHRCDTTVSSATHDGRTTTYGRSPAGWTESLTDWRAKASTFAFSPAGSPTATTLGSGAASSTRSYTADGMPASLVWSAGGTTVRSHSAIAYDVGGLRTAENVAVVHPPTAVSADTGGPATYAYDLARRLVSFTSAYKAALVDTAKPTTTWGLDDGANIASATTVVAGQTRLAESSSYPGGRLATRHRIVTPATGLPSSADTAFSYSTLGEETTRTTTTTTTGGVPPPATTTTTTAYDAAGHVASAEGVNYVYDGTDHLVSRKAGLDTTLYFYWGGGTTLAEENDGAGATLARYVVDDGDVVAQHTFRRIPGAGKDPSDTNGTWAWLLDDPAGNVATQVGDNGAVLTQAAFDPYGVPEALGGSQAPGTKASSLGFQAALTDGATKKVMLGPRQYDPATARFTNPDVFVAGVADVQLGADGLTGNRFLFAAANPVAYYEDGHCAFGKETKTQKVSGYRNERRSKWVENPNSPGGGFWGYEYVQQPTYEARTICVRTGRLGELVDFVSANDITRQQDPGYRNRYGNSSLLGAGAMGLGLLALPAGGWAGLAIGGFASVVGVAGQATNPAPCKGGRIASGIATGALGAVTGGVGGSLVREAVRGAGGRVMYAAGRALERMSALGGVGSNFLNRCLR